VGVDFIITASQPLRSVTFDLLPHQYSHPIFKDTTQFTAHGPFIPGHAYKFRGPKLHGKNHAWPKLKSGSTCQTLVGMTIRFADGKVVRVGKNEIGQYLTPNVDTACGPPPSAPAR
jgi:hypothetical protein